MNKKELAKQAQRELAKKNQNNTQKEEVKMEVKDQVVEENTLVDAAASEAVIDETKVEEAAVEKVEEELKEAAQETAEVNQETVEEPVKEEAPKKEDKRPLTEAEKSYHIINQLIAKHQGLKIVASDSKTGVSYFTGKNRLCKLLKTKRGVTLEINVVLPQALKDLPEMENISASLAAKKHLGTMKHLYRANDAKMVPAIMKEAIAIFKANLDAAKAKDQAEEKQAVNQ